MTTERYQQPPWFQDLRATFTPSLVTSSQIVIEHTEELIQQSTTTKSPKSGRYYVISDTKDTNDDKNDETKVIIIATVCIVSSLATVICIVLVYHLVKRRDTLHNADKIQDSQYHVDNNTDNTTLHNVHKIHDSQYHVDNNTDTRTLHNVGKLHNSQYHVELSDNNTDNRAPFNHHTETKSLPYLNSEYSEPQEQPHSLSGVIGGDNYVVRGDRHCQVIMHTVVQGDNGDIRVIHPRMDNGWSSHPDLFSSREQGNNKLERENNISGLSPIQISFNESGRHFVNLNLHS